MLFYSKTISDYLSYRTLCLVQIVIDFDDLYPEGILFCKFQVSVSYSLMKAYRLLLHPVFYPGPLQAGLCIDRAPG